MVRVPRTGHRVSYGLVGLFCFFNLEEENCRWGDKADDMNLLGHPLVPSKREYRWIIVGNACEVSNSDSIFLQV